MAIQTAITPLKTIRMHWEFGLGRLARFVNVPTRFVNVPTLLFQIGDYSTYISHMPTAMLTKQNNAASSSHSHIDNSPAQISHTPTATGGKSRKGKMGKSKGDDD